MKIGHFFACFVLMTGGVVAACGGGGGTTGSGSGGASSADSFITQYCDSLAPCCAKSNKTYDQGKCRAVFIALTGSSTYDAVAGQQCLDAVHAEANSPTFCDTGLSTDGSAKCKSVYAKGASKGTKQPGETCEDDAECASTADGEGNCATTFSKDASVRTCQIQARGKLGDDCVGETETTNGTTITSTSGSGTSGGPPPTRVVLCFIADGLFCESTFVSGSTTQTRKCAKIQDIGGPCTSTATHACVKAAFCDTKAKACAPRIATGAACVGDQCVEKNYCNSTTKTCTPSVANGGTCVKNEECENHSCTNGKCSSGSSISSSSFVCQ